MSGFTHTQLFWDHWAKLGGCTKCMRQSCAVCIGSWIGLILALWIGAAEIACAAGVLAALATALFISHIATYARNKVAAAESDLGGKVGRRRALQVALGASASVLFIIAMNRPALAASDCGGWHGECGACYKNFFLNQDPRGCHYCRSCENEMERRGQN
jgi:hypothetical protein